MVFCRNLITRPPQLWLLRCSRPFTTGRLHQWLAAVKAIPIEKILPAGFGGQREVETAAWHGDKILALAIAEELRARIHLKPGHLTEIYSAAASNENMSKQLEAILPSSHFESVPVKDRMLQTHNCGTMLEACVSYVNEAGDKAAVAELARHLLDTSNQQRNDVSSKGKLLAMGGSLNIISQSGSDHEPIFIAEARIGETTATAEGTSKKKAEQDASKAALKALKTAGVNTEQLKTMEQPNSNSTQKVCFSNSNFSDSHVGMAAVAGAPRDLYYSSNQQHHDDDLWRVKVAEMLNPKGELLEVGGSVDIISQSGYDHQPTFIAEARIGETTATAEGSSKKKTEQEASRAVLFKYTINSLGKD